LALVIEGLVVAQRVDGFEVFVAERALVAHVFGRLVQVAHVHAQPARLAKHLVAIAAGQAID
jgi:hypothetical protein